MENVNGAEVDYIVNGGYVYVFETRMNRYRKKKRTN